MVGAVQDLVLSEAHGLKLLFVLHSDGMLRVWNLSFHNKILSHALGIPNSEGKSYDFSLFVGSRIASFTPFHGPFYVSLLRCDICQIMGW